MLGLVKERRCFMLRASACVGAYLVKSANVRRELSSEENAYA